VVEPILEPADHVTLAVARNLTAYKDARIPQRLPADPDARLQALDKLTAVADDYTERAHQDAVVDARSTPESVVLGAKSIAGRANEVVRSWSKWGAPAGAGASAVANPVVEGLMIAVLTWRIATSSPTATEFYLSDVEAAAAFAAGESRALYRGPGPEAALHC